MTEQTITPRCRGLPRSSNSHSDGQPLMRVSTRSRSRNESSWSPIARCHLSLIKYNRRMKTSDGRRTLAAAAAAAVVPCTRDFMMSHLPSTYGRSEVTVGVTVAQGCHFPRKPRLLASRLWSCLRPPIHRQPLGCPLGALLTRYTSDLS